MAKSKIFSDWLQVTEGSFVEHQDNSDLDTIKGLTYRDYKKHCKDALDKSPSRNHFRKLTKDEYDAFINILIWEKIMGDEIRSQRVANLLAYCCHLSTPFDAIKYLQKTLTESEGVFLDDTGVMDSKTIGTLNQSPTIYKKLHKSLQEQLADKAKKHNITYKLLHNWTQQLNMLMTYNQKMSS